MKNKPWFSAYDPQVPTTLTYPETCLQEFLFNQARYAPGKTAIICEDHAYSYRKIAELSLAFARSLLKMGLTTGDRVGICLPNTLEFVVAFYGTLIAGGVVAAMNPQYPKRELEFQIRTAEIRFLVGYDVRLADFLDLKNNTGFDQIILVESKGDGSSEKKFPDDKNGISQFSLLCLNSSASVQLPEIICSQPAVFQFSGGTTGTPKVAIGLHRNIVANVIQFKHWLTPMRDGEETFLVAIPLYHVYGMVLGLNLGMAMGAKMVLMRDPRKVELLLSHIQEYQVTYFPGVPSMFNSINEYVTGLDRQVDLRTIKACISGSAPLLEPIREKFEKLTGSHLVEGYGLSEAPTATHCNPLFGGNRNGSIGLPLPDVDCRIVDIDNRNVEVQPGQIGELLIRGPQVMSGYYKQPGETHFTLEGGWLHTGDIARMDADGYFYIVGRLKELIKVGGLQVWPNEIEDVLIHHPKIKEVAAAGIPDLARGEVVKVWVVPQPDQQISLAEIRSFCKNKLAVYKIPVEMEVIVALPRSPVGKVLRRELIALR